MSSIPVSKTKIIPPRRRAEILTRKRLLDVLFEALDKQLALVSAPAGYGKTSLLIDLVDQSELRCCWLSLDELDREPQRFAAYFIAAITEQFPTFGSQSKYVLENMPSFEQDMERLLVTICNEIIEKIGEHFIFVLDDFHILEGVQPIQNFVNRFIQLMNENCHLIISSRILSSLSDLPRLVARDQVSGLSIPDLAFQPHELQALLAQNDKVHISDGQANQLIAETEGWITGLQFSGADILPRNSGSLAGRDGTGLFDYLGQQVLDQQPADLQEFILRTALFEEFDEVLCEMALSPFYSEKQDWQKLIKTISTNNLFALPVGADGKWLRYHHLFRDFIRTRFERERPQEAAPILSRLESAYETMGEWEKAHYICKKLNDPNLLAEMIERAGTSMLLHAHLTIEAWLNDLPPSILRARPGLLSISGTIAHLSGDQHEGLRLLRKAEEIFRQRQDVYGLTLTLVRLATVNRFLGDYPASLRDAEEVIELTEISDELQEYYAEALRVKGLALFRLGQARQAVEFLEDSLNINVRLNETPNIPILMMETGMAYRATGNFEEAGKAYGKALKIWRQEGNLPWLASLLNNLGGLHHVQGEYEAAAQAFEEGLLCAQRSHYTRLDVLISIGFGDLYSELEDFSMAAQYYQYASDASQGMDDRFLFYSLAFARINLALLQNDAATAGPIVKSIEKPIRSGRSNYENGFLSLLYGRYYLLENPNKALSELQNAERCFSEDGRTFEAAISRLWQAAYLHKTGEQPEASQIIADLHRSRGRAPHTFVVAVHQAREWLGGVPPDSKSAQLIRDLLLQADHLAKKIPHTRRQLRRQTRLLQGPTPHLTVRAFGQAEVGLGGKPLTLSDWQTQSVRDLFFYFLTTSKPMTKEQIGEIIWQDVDEPSKLKLRFKNDIYRLRRAVGQEAIVYNDSYYSFNQTMDYEYDVEAFESFIATAKKAELPQQQMELYQKAVDLVTGPYLKDIYADWVIHDRERLNQIHLNSLAVLANLYLTNAQPEKALEICRRAIAVDPGMEIAYQISMQAYHRLSDHPSIRRTYQACVEAMKRLYDLPPSQETKEQFRLYAH